MDNLIELHQNKTMQSNELLELLMNTIDINAVNMDYYAIIGVLEMIKEQIKDDMNE